MLSLFLAAQAAAHATPAKGQHFDHVVIVMFENTNYASAIENPFFKKFAADGALLSNYQGVTHPSQGNYIALTSGDINGAPDDDNYDLAVKHIGDLLEEKGLTWKNYAEAYPGHCYKGMTEGTYWRKHTPMISYTSIQRDPKKCAGIVNAAEFERDLRAHKLPNYSFFTPDINNDGHDTGVTYAAKWFEHRFAKLLENPSLMKDTLVIATFDENAGEPDMRVYTALRGPMVKKGSYGATLNHYSLLRMIEDNFRLGTLGKKDASAPRFPDIWDN